MGELGMIQSIEELGAKLHFEPLRDRGGFGQRDVEIGKSWTTQHIAAQSVGSVGRVMHRIKLREAGIGKASVLKVGIVLEWHVGKTIGVKDKVASDRVCADLANRACGVGAVGDLLNCANLAGIKRPYGRNHRGARKTRIARARRTRVEGVGEIGQLGWNVDGESGSIGKDGVETPAFGQALRPRGPRAIDRQIPSPTDADAMADVGVTRSVEKTRAIGGYSGIALLETGGIVEVMAVGIGEGVVNRAQVRVFGLPRQARFEGVVVRIGYCLLYTSRCV